MDKEQIKKLVKQHTKQGLADKCGVSLYTVTEWCLGRRNPSGSATILLNNLIKN